MPKPKIVRPRIAKNLEGFTLIERLQLEPLLPKRASYIDLLTVQKLRDEFLVSPEEVTEFELAPHPSGGLTWNRVKVEAAGPKGIHLVEHSRKVLKDALKAASDGGNLPVELVEVFERFVPKKERATQE